MIDDYSAIDEVHEDYKKERKTQENLINKIPMNAKLIAAGLLMLTIWYFGFTHADWKKVFFISGAILVILYIWATSSEDVEGELTELQLRTLLWKQLRYYQLNPFGENYVIPDGQIKFLPNVARWTVGEKVKYRTYAIAIVKRNNLWDYYGVDVNVFTGDIVKIQEGYFKGTERPHVKYIESEDVSKKKRYEEAVGTSKK
jgi:hypothetical protein